MKNIKQGIIGAFALLLASAVHTFAIEGLQISVQCSNVVLSWPSDEYNGETYIVQYRADLTSTNPWTTLTNYMPPDAGTNLTFFIHSNIVQHPNCSDSASSSMMMAASTASRSPESLALRAAARAQRMAQFTNDIALLMPPAQPVTRVPFKRRTALASEAVSSLAAGETAAMETNGLQPPGENSPSGSGSATTPETGFYRVVRNGPSIFGLTNDTVLSGLVSFPVEAGYDQGTLVSLTLNANGSPIEGAISEMAPFSPHPSFIVDTRRLNNGTTYFQPGATWQVPRNNSFESPFDSLFGQAKAVIVSNLICYPYWVSEVTTNQLLFKAQALSQNIDWAVDIYGATNNYILTFTNHSDVGTIEFAWDLTDANGTPSADSSFHSVSRLTDLDTGATASSASPPLVRVVDNFPDQGKWIVAQLDFIPHNLNNFSLWQNALNTIAQMAEQDGGVLPESGTERSYGQTLAIPAGSANTNYAGWSTIFFTMYTNRAVRNFYYMGHGNPDYIGDDNYGFASATLATILNNVTTQGQSVSTNATRYRFVWLDACLTANGSWPAAFGIGARENVPLDSFTSRPAAFCGYTTSPRVADFTINPNGTASGSVQSKAANFRSNFVFYWQLIHQGLAETFESAKRDSGYSDANNLKIYGYSGLHWNEFNTKGEWPR